MEIKMGNAKHTCCVCGKEFEMSKDIRYTAINSRLLDCKRYDAMDCPYCGCQNIFQERKLKEDDRVKEMEKKA